MPHMEYACADITGACVLGSLDAAQDTGMRGVHDGFNPP